MAALACTTVPSVVSTATPCGASANSRSARCLARTNARSRDRSALTSRARISTRAFVVVVRQSGDGNLVLGTGGGHRQLVGGLLAPECPVDELVEDRVVPRTGHLREQTTLRPPHAPADRAGASYQLDPVVPVDDNGGGVGEMLHEHAPPSLGEGQRAFGLDSRGVVEADAQEAVDSAVRVVQLGEDQAHESAAPVGAEVGPGATGGGSMRQRGEHRDAGTDAELECDLRDLGRVVEQLQVGESYEVLGAMTEQFLGSDAESPDGPVQVGRDDAGQVRTTDDAVHLRACFPGSMGLVVEPPDDALDDRRDEDGEGGPAKGATPVDDVVQGRTHEQHGHGEQQRSKNDYHPELHAGASHGHPQDRQGEEGRETGLVPPVRCRAKESATKNKYGRHRSTQVRSRRAS